MNSAFLSPGLVFPFASPLSNLTNADVSLSCSVVIPTSGRPDELERCLAAVSVQDYPSYDVIVVDNSDGDPETERVARKWKARYVLERKRGLCRARNRGALVSSADIIA